MQPEQIRVILVDDHDIIHREFGGLIAILDEIELVAEGYNGQEAIDLCNLYQPDIVLMDVSMPVMDGIVATRMIMSRHPDIKIIAMTGMDDEATVHKMLAAGAVGYILKGTPPDELDSIIRATFRNNTVFSAKVARMMLKPRLNSQPARDYGLTRRELEVLRCLIDGKTNPEIADSLSVSLATVKFHISNIFTKLEVSSRSAAVGLAVEQHLVD